MGAFVVLHGHVYDARVWYGSGVRRAVVALAAGCLCAAALVVAPAGLAATCDNAPLPGAPTVRVLVFGDSLTAGSAGDWTWRYRYWQQQRALGVNVEFVGPIEGMMATADYPVDNNQAYADPCFAQRAHWAIGGKKLSATFNPPWWLTTAEDPPSEIAWAVANYAPDVVVEFMGGNDLTKTPTATPQQVLDLAQAFVGEVRKADPATDVAVVTTTSNMVASAETYNELLRSQAPTWSTTDSRVGVIDVMRDWQGTADTWDRFHPHAMGEMHLAWDVGDGLAAMGFGKKPSWPVPVVPLGPRTPPVLTLTGRGDSSVTLSWTSPIGADREIVWLRDMTTGGPWTTVTSVTLASGTTLTGLAAHRYEVRVQAAKGTAVAENLYSNTVSADLTVPVTLGKVLAPRAVPRYHAIALSWAAASGATSYRVRWHRTGSTAWASRVTTSTTTSVSGLVAGASYGFTVTPLRTGMTGTPSPQTVAKPQGTVNPAVPRPRLAIVSGHRLWVGWSRAVAPTRYQVLLRRGSGPWRTVRWTTGTRMVTGTLVRGARYYVRVRAWDGYVPGALSPIAGIRMR